MRLDFNLSSMKPSQCTPKCCKEFHGFKKEYLAQVADYYERLIREKDALTATHSLQVALLMEGFASFIGMSADKVFAAYLAGLLHDFGKVYISREILQKPAKLTPEEMKTVQKHPAMGADILARTKGFSVIANAVRHHHEKYAGTGYPDRLKGEEIPFLSRMLAICDSFDAMTSARYYRSTFTIEQAIEEIELSVGKQFDPGLSRAFIAYLQQEN